MSRIEELARRMAMADPYGALHIAVDDGNLDDAALSFCEREPMLKPDERELLAYMRAFSEAERERAWMLMLEAR